MMKEQSISLEYTDVKDVNGFWATYYEDTKGVKITLIEDGKETSIEFPASRKDEAHICWMITCELLKTRTAINESEEGIRAAFEKLFFEYRGGGGKLPDITGMKREASTKDIFTPNPGKVIEREVNGVKYLRLPVRTRIITTDDTDIVPVIEQYAAPHLQKGDMLFVSEKAVCVTQGGIVNMSDIKVTPLARLLARNVVNNYGTADFKGFGHGTDMAMQVFIEEAGYLRALLAAAVAAVTRPLGIKGMFYRLCGKSAKSVDCPMSFLILEYAHYAKLAPKDPDGVAKRIRDRFNCETVILDANYRGAFSLGKSDTSITESFIEELFKDNPLGQSDEMTPFAIVRRA